MKHVRAMSMVAAAMLLHAGAGAPAAAGQGQKAAPKVAIVCQEAAEARADEIDALLTAEFSRSKAFTLVERNVIRTLLGEQKLQVLSDTRGALKLGQLAGADLLLLVAPLKGATPAILRTRLVETTSGLILLDTLLPVGRLVQEPATLRELLETHVHKTATPVAERQLLALVGVRSGEPGRTLDSLAQVLDVLLRGELVKSPKVFMLEREQAERLTAERDLSGMDVKLRSSTMLLDLTLKRGQAADEVDITIRLGSMAGGKSRTLTVTGPAKDPATLRRKLADDILKALETPAGGQVGGDVVQEAAAFAERARLLTTHGYVADGARLAEAAYALDPKLEHGKVAADAYSGLANRWSKLTPRLQAMRRCVEIRIDVLSRATPDITTKKMYAAFSPSTAVGFFLDDKIRQMYPVTGAPEQEEKKLLQEVTDLMLAEQRLWLDFVTKRGGSADSVNSQYVMHMPFLVRNGQEYRAWMIPALEEAQRQTATAVKSRGFESTTFLLSHQTFLHFEEAQHAGNVTLDDTRPIVEWMLKQPEIMIRIAGYSAKSCYPGKEGEEAAVAGANLLLREAPDSFTLAKHRNETAAIPAIPIFRRLGWSGLADSYIKGLFDEAEAKKDVRLLLRSTTHLSPLFHDLRVSKEKRLEVYLQGLRILETGPVPEGYADNLKRMHKTLTYFADVARGKTEKDLVSKAEISTYDVKQIKLEGAPASMKMIWMQLDRGAKQMYFVWRGQPENATAKSALFDVRVTRMGIEGGAMTEVARGKVAGVMAQGMGTTYQGLRITGGAVTPDGLFLTDFGKGVMVVREGKISVWGEKEGLPTRTVWCVAYANGKLYVGMDGGWAEIDAKTGACRMMAASKSLPSANPLDGGTLYRVGNILAMPDGKSLWLSVGGDTSRSGIWRYELDTRQCTRLAGPREIAEAHGPSLSWNGDLILATSPYMPSGLYDPATGKRVKELAKYDFAPTRSFLEPEPGAHGGLGGSVSWMSGSGQGERDDPAIDYRAHRRLVLLGQELIVDSGAIHLGSWKRHRPESKPFGEIVPGWWHAVEWYEGGFIGVNYGFTSYEGKVFPPGVWVVRPQAKATKEGGAKSKAE